MKEQTMVSRRLGAAIRVDQRNGIISTACVDETTEKLMSGSDRQEQRELKMHKRKCASAAAAEGAETSDWAKL